MIGRNGVESLDQPRADEGVESLPDCHELKEPPFGSGSFFASLRERFSPAEPQEVQPVERVGSDESELPLRRPNKELREQYEGEYIEPDTEPAHVDRFAHPSEFLETINPHFQESKAYQVNCWDCARAVESTWRGHPEVAAGRAALPGESEPDGEYNDRSEAWYGRKMQPTNPQEIRGRLLDAGEGASALVTVHYEYSDAEGFLGEAGHAFNFVNHHGEVLLVDGQSGQVAEADGGWPPATWSPAVHMISMTAMSWNREGQSI